MLGNKKQGFFTPVSIIIVLILTSLTAITGVISYNSAYDESFNMMQKQNLAIINRLEGWLSVKASRVEHNALVLRELNMDLEMLIDYFTMQADIMEDVSIAFVGYPDGSIIFGGEWGEVEDVYITERPWYTAALESPGEVKFSRPYLGAATGNISFAVARTVSDYDDSLGVVALSLSFASFADFIMEQENYVNQYSYFVLDYDGSLIFHSDPTFAPLNHTYFYNIYDILGGRYGSMFEAIRNIGFYTGHGSIYMGVPMTLTDWYLIIRVPAQYIISDIIPTIVSLFTTALFSLAVLIGTWIALRKLRLSSEKERQSNELNRTLLDASPLLVVIRDENFNVIDCNKKTLDIYGLSSAEEFIKDCDELFTPLIQPCGKYSHELNLQYAKDVIKHGSIRYEWMYRFADNAPLPVEITQVLVKDKKSPIIISYIHDLRETKKAMEQAHIADERASIMMGAAPISCFMIKPLISDAGLAEFEALDFNKSAIDLFGFSSKAEAIERFYEIFPVADEDIRVGDAIQTCVQNALKSGYDQFEFVHKNLRGEFIPCEITVVRGEYRGDLALTCFQDDLRSIKAAMDYEKYAHSVTQMFLDAAPFFIEIWDRDFNLADCNEATVKTFGLSKKEEYIEGYTRFYPEFQPCGIPSKEKIRKLLQACLTKGYVRDDWMHITAQGNDFPVDVTYVRLRRDNEFIVVGYSQDLRPLISATAQRHEAEKESQAKTRFLARMSHEIRTPMNSVIGISEIELNKNIYPPETEEAFRRIYNSSKLLLNIINDILDLSKVESGKMEIIDGVYDTASLISDTVQLNLMYIGSKPIEFKLEVDQDLPAQMIGDGLRIKQILNNLISNAFKYTDEGEVTLSFIKGKGTETADVSMMIRVADTGQGMDEDQLKRLFDTEFTRFNVEKNYEVEGSGLGMSIAHSLLKIMDGTIKANSTPGVGTIFVVSIPQKIEGEAVLGRELAENLQNFEFSKSLSNKVTLREHEPMPYGRVLAVDDVESNLYVIKGHLKPYGLTVETAESGLKAVSKVMSGQVYDIILMDHMMPVMDGIEATKVLRNLGYRQPIIALTANATVGVSQMFLDNGFNDFISKPIDPIKLDGCLMKYVSGKQSSEARAFSGASYLESVKKNRGIISESLKDSFLMDAKNCISVLEPLIELDNLDEKSVRLFTIQAHGVKSALINVGEKKLSDFAASLEKAGRDNDIDTIKSSTPKFLEELRKIIGSYSEHDRVEVVTDKNAENNNMLVAEKLEAVSVACESYDLAGAREILEEISLFNDTAVLVKDIETHLLMGDYYDASEHAKRMAAELAAKGDG